MKIPKKNILLALGLGVLLGLVSGRGCFSRQSPKEESGIHALHEEEAAEFWTCSMHPQIQKPNPGSCPLCGMDLIPVVTDSSSESDNLREISLSPAALKLAQIDTAPVARRSVAVEIRMIGQVQFDETRLATISPRVDGRIDRLMANYTGMPVQKGDPLADLYSPEWVAAQQELLQAVKASGGAESALLKAARERLRLWGLSAEQIAAMEQQGQVRDHVTFFSPISGTVVEMAAREGQYVKTGMRLFTVADLTHVWVELEAYESDLAWLREGQDVAFTTEAVPGETFTGTIDFIHPVLNPATRTVKVRVEADNADGFLKPGYFVRAVVQAPATEEGAEAPLVIPATAPLLTGRRAVVYVAVPEQEGTYEGREVVLGPRAGDVYIVRKGLKEGDQVVTHGAFKLDAELQVRAKPSMMSRENGGQTSAIHEPPAMNMTHGATHKTMQPQTTCPIMGGTINKDVFVDYNGMRIYFCCAGCEDEFLKKPEDYLNQMREQGVEPERDHDP